MTQQEISDTELDIIHEQISLIVVKNRLKNKTHNVITSVYDPIEEFMEAYKEVNK